MNTIKLTVGSEFGIALGGAVAPTAVMSRMADLTISKVTEKAVQFTDGKHYIFLPQKALVPPKGQPYSGDWATLASWFKPNSFQNFVLNRNSETSGVSI